MNKKVSIILIVLLIIIVTSIVIINLKQIKPNVSVNTATEDTNIVKNEENNEITAEERKNVEEYVDQICNKSLNSKLPVFNDINEADKVWIYSHLTSEDGTEYITKEQIEKQLRDLFGNKLNINVEEDIKSRDDVVMPTKGETYGEYILPIFGMDNLTYYIIESIEKLDNKYKVNVIEFNVATDFDSDGSDLMSLVSTYDETMENGKKWKTVFKIANTEAYPDGYSKGIATKVIEDVLKQKDKFQNYSIIIEEDNDSKLNINEVKQN